LANQAAIRRTVYISFDAGIYQKQVQTLISFCVEQIQNGFDHIYLLFSTSGGSVNEGITLYNTLRGLPATITIHNSGNVDSVGNVIFLAGGHRYACPHSTFMFHGVGWDFNNPHRMDEKSTRETLDDIISSQRRMGSIIADRTTLPPEEIATLFAEAQTKDTDFAVKNGIIHEVRNIKVPSGAVVIPLVFDV
jgi:ATP-dependent Clp protease protease subunit